ncbi:MAG: hypothetical protein ABI222_01045 [Opitutaceae bacterium]
MTAPVSIIESAPRARGGAFTLLEVIVSLGLLSVTVVAILALHGYSRRAVADLTGQERAAQLGDAVAVELTRLRDLPAAEGHADKLEALSALVPSGDGAQALRLVAGPDGTRVTRESEADDQVKGLALRDRYYLIEVRQQLPPLNYSTGAGYLALGVTIKWPYQMAIGPDPDSAVTANPEQASVMMLNVALAP